MKKRRKVCWLRYLIDPFYKHEIDTGKTLYEFTKECFDKFWERVKKENETLR